MAVSTESIVKQLMHFFPDKIIYKQEYSYELVGYALDHEIRRAFKAAGIPRGQWLREQGFDWREYGYVEKDMRSRSDIAIDTSGAFALADSVIRKCALLGEYEPSEEEMGMLLQAAQTAFQKATWDNGKLTQEDQVVLTFTTVQLLKSWSPSLADESSDNTFWNYIYLQYGFRAEESEGAEERVYSRFRGAIKAALNTKGAKRFMTERGMKYYTSMLLHAIAPEQSVRNLYDVLFDFYINNLNYQYVPHDPIYGTFVKGMQARWDADKKKESDIHLRSDTVYSGLRTLFQERPGYMAHICDLIVQRMDRLVRDEPVEAENRWVSILQEWFREKTQDEKFKVRKEREGRRTEFIAATSDRIYVRYAIEDLCVGLQIPQIRLPEVRHEHPKLTVYQGERQICSKDMSVSGNELGMTTRRVFLPLKDTDFDFASPPMLRAEISYGGELLYASESKLFRKYLLFDTNGSEHDIRKGTAYLFADESAEIGFADDEDVYQENHPGQLLRLNLDSVGAVTLSGEEIFADEQQAGKVRLYPSIQPVRDVRALKDGFSARIFDDAFDVVLRIPDGESRLRYRVSLDGTLLENAKSRSDDRECVFSLGSGAEPFVPHAIRVLDLSTSYVVLEYSYVIFPHTAFRLDKALYTDADRGCTLTVSENGSEDEMVMIRPDGTDSAVSSRSFHDFALEADLPALHVTMGDKSLFDLPEKLWFETIKKSDHVRMSVPDGWTSTMMLGTRSIEPNADGLIELGNYLYSGRQFAPQETLGLLLRSGSRLESMFLTDIVFEPVFSKPPLSVEQGDLIWAPGDGFFGRAGSRFRVAVSGKRDFSFDVTAGSCKVTHLDDACRGFFRYTVSILSEGLFSKGSAKEIYSGEFLHGDKDSLRFDEREAVLLSAVYWDMRSDSLKSTNLRTGAGILESLQYVGKSTPSGEAIPLPEYSAVLCYATSDGQRKPFNFDEDSVDYEWVNPVKIWVINEHRLILRKVSDDAVYLDSATNTIANKNPERYMTRAAQRSRLQIPDYFDYTKQKEML